MQLTQKIVGYIKKMCNFAHFFTEFMNDFIELECAEQPCIKVADIDYFNNDLVHPEQRLEIHTSNGVFHSYESIESFKAKIAAKRYEKLQVGNVLLTKEMD